MRKDILGITLFFLVVFILISLLSYSPSDPSINHATLSDHNIENVFGLLGAHLSGMLVCLFGLGSFWIPLLLILSCIHFFKNKSGRDFFYVFFGGIILVVTTGSIFAFKQNHYVIFKSSYSSGGIIGIPLKSFLVKYSNFPGAVIILVLFFIVGLVMATGFSPAGFIRFCSSFFTNSSFFIKSHLFCGIEMFKCWCVQYWTYEKNACIDIRFKREKLACKKENLEICNE